MSLSIKMTFPKEFVDLYNKIHQTDTGRKMLEIEGIDRDNLDMPAMSKKYFSEKNIADMSVDANANANDNHNINLNNYMAEIVKAQHKIEGYYLLYRELEKQYGEARAKHLLKSTIYGDVYFHDSTNIQVPYCFSMSTSSIMTNGRNWGQLKSTPPKRLRSFMSQVIETVMDFSQEQAGAIAVADLIVNMSYYTLKEKTSDKELENELQNFVHIMNNTFRVSGQSPFTNISVFDDNNLKTLFDGYVFPDFSKPNFKEIQRIQKIFVEFFSKCDPMTSLPYRFPVVTATFLIDPPNGYNLDLNFLDMIAENNYKKGIMNIYGAKDVGKIASCCRLINDTKLLGGDSFGNGGVNIGSARVVTINLPRLGLDAKKHKLDHYDVIKLLDERLEEAHDMLKAHRQLLHKRAEKGFLKFVKPLGFINIDKHLFSTIGINGMYEMMYFLYNGDIYNDEGKYKPEVIEHEKEIIKYINNKTKSWQLEENIPYNVEQVPAESLAPKNAMKDKILFGEDNQPFDLYSNQFVPLGVDMDVYDRIKQEGEFFSELSGGGITHINLKAPMQTKEDMIKMMLFAFNNGNEHFAINYSFNQCEDGHVVIGSNDEDICKVCGKTIEKRLTRVIGYFTEVSSWNRVRRNNYNKRVFK